MLQKIRTFLVAASSEIIDIREKEKAELLATLLLFRLLMLIPITQFLWAYGLQSAFQVIAVLIIANIIGYFVSRTKNFKIGAVIWTLEMLVGVTAVTYVIGDRIESTIAPAWFCLAVLAGSLFLSARSTLYVFFGSCISCVFVFFAVAVENRSSLHGTIVFTLCCSALIVISAYRNEKTDHLLEAEKAKVMEVSKLSSLGEMAGGVAHEINSPLNAMMMSAEIIASQISDDHDAQKSLRTILLSGEKIATIIKGLRAFSRDSKEEARTLTPASDFVKMTLDLCKSKFELHRIRIVLNEKNFNSLVYGIGSQYSQVLLNLLTNSFDALRLVEDKWISLDAKVENNFVIVSIVDSGIGIPPKIADKIFQPFFTTKDIGSGSGLGLSISKGLMQQNGGDLIYVPSSDNTRFHMRIPRMASAGLNQSSATSPG